MTERKTCGRARTIKMIIGMGLAASAAILGACGGEDGLPSVGAPQGEALLPDLTPAPPLDVRTTTSGNVLLIRFSSTLINVGEGDFVLRATREFGEWAVEQEVQYSEDGGELSPTEAAMVWGGDGHEHWHVQRVVSYHLVPLDASGNVIDDDLSLVDSKIGFCFFDHQVHNDSGPDEPVFSVHACGNQDDNELRIGMSVGWADSYSFTLPGQSIAITTVPDGDYRLLAEVDAAGWFRDANLDNNLTWVDLELSTGDDDLRVARIIGVGPEPG